MKQTILLLPFLFFFFPLLSQQSLEDLLWSSRSFEEIVEEGETYFKKKHPNIALNKLSQGEYRDGEFVKFMRWRSYWKNSLNPDGTLGDVAAYVKAAQKRNTSKEKSLSPYREVTWSNVSHEDYIISQIGLGRTTSIGFHPTDPNTFYVGAAIGGIWKTTDGGQNYMPLGDDLPFMAVSSIIVNKNTPSSIYIAISDHVWYGPPSIGVYKSSDGGANWTPTALSFDLADNVRIYWMEADPNNPSKMFVATSDGLYRTDAAFNTIVKVNDISTFDVKVNPANSNIVYQGGRNGEFYRSTDGGVNFSFVSNFGSDEVYIMTTPLNATKVYARNGNKLHKSNNSGASFSNVNTLSTTTGLFVFSPTDQTVLIGGSIGVNFPTERSNNDGSTFFPTSNWLGNNELPSIHVDQRNIFVNPLENNYVYYCNDGGVYRYVINTGEFQNLCDGLKITQFYDIAVSQTDENVIGGGSQDNGNIYRESDGIWDDYEPTGDGMNQEIDPTDANTRYWAYQNGSLHRWVNGVNTYIAPLGKSGVWETPYRLDPNNPSRIVAGYDAVYSSIDKGNVWLDISGPIFGGNLNEIAIAKSNSNRIYATRDDQLFVKDTLINSWTTKTMPGSIADIEVDPMDMNLIYVVVAGYNGGEKVYQSADAGTTWQNITGSLPNISVDAIEMYENIPGAMFIGTDIGVFYRDNTQADWQTYGDLPNTRIDDIEIQYASKLIRVGTHGRGVLEAPIIIESCELNDPDTDGDGICDANDACPDFDNSLIGTPCDDGDPNTTGEIYTANCECSDGRSNIVYCNAQGAAGTGGDWIKRVSLNDLDHSSTQTAYSDFTDQSATLGMGSSYTLKVDLNATFSLDEIYAWIDYNRNGVFESSELIDMSSIVSNQSEGTVDVPADIGTGATTMRVRVIYADPNNPEPCGSIFGEVEDYTINFTYCDAQGAFGTGADWISNVQVGTINNASAKTLYSDFTHFSTELAQGSSSPIDVTVNYAFDLDEVYVWIDFNQNEIFESSEQVAMSDLIVGNDAISSGMINVPADAVSGKTRMRVRVLYADPNNPESCGVIFGEVEDYVIKITEACIDSDMDGVCDDVDVCIGYSDVPLVLMDDHTSSEDYKSVTEIESTAGITAGIVVNYEAGQSITLKDGFHAMNGTSFRAFISDCTATTLENEINVSEWVEQRSDLEITRSNSTLKIYPNPASAFTTLTVQMKEGGAVNLQVFDIRGKKVKSLMNNQWLAAGIYNESWITNGFESGVYFIVLQTTNEVITKKIIIRE